MRDSLLHRGLAGAGLLGAFTTFVFYLDSLPLPHPPAYGGAGHTAMAPLVFGGLIVGAVFFPSRWARAHAWAAAIALGIFEFSYGLLGRLSAMSAPRLEGHLPLAAGAGLMFLLLTLPDLLAPMADSSGQRGSGVVSEGMRRIAAFFPGSAIGRLFRRLLSQW